MPHHNYKGQEHAGWKWAVQLLITVAGGVALFLLIAFLVGWLP